MQERGSRLGVIHVLCSVALILTAAEEAAGASAEEQSAAGPTAAAAAESAAAAEEAEEAVSLEDQLLQKSQELELAKSRISEVEQKVRGAFGRGLAGCRWAARFACTVRQKQES